MASKLEAARALIARGFKIFPITENAKFPPLLADWPTLATNDPFHVNLQWSDRGTPMANIGIHCEGFIVIDVDTKKDGKRALDLIRLSEDLPATLCARTPSGGEHYFYRLPDGHPGVPNSVDELGRGLDVRSTGGYVVAAGSTVPLGDYAWADPSMAVAPAPAWLRNRLGTGAGIRNTALHDDRRVHDAPDQSVARAADWLARQAPAIEGQGGDRHTFTVACGLRDQGVSADQALELLQSWNEQCEPPWAPADLQAKVRNAYAYAQNESGGRGVVEDDLPAPIAIPEAPKKPKKRSRLVRLDEYAEEAGVGAGYVVKNLLNRASYVVAFGSPGAGKSFVLLDVGYHVAQGKPWMSLNVHQGSVLYLAFEGYGGLKKRAKALRQRYGANLGPFYLVDANMNLREQAGRQELGAIMAEMPSPPTLVVIDTFARALMGGDENSAQDVGAFNDAIAKLIGATGACVVLIHHSGKNKAAGARGSSAILGAIDTELEIDHGQIRPSKQRDVELLPPIAFKLRPTVVGIDSDGDEEKSCVVEQGPSVAAGTKPMTGKGEHAFAILCELTGPENKPVSRARFVAKLKDEEFGRSAAHEWVRKLQRYGKLTVENDMVSRRMT